MIVLATAAGLLTLALILGLPRRLVWSMLGCLWAGAILVHLLLPAGHALRSAVGGDWRAWALPGVLAAAALAYAAGLKRLRARAAPPAPARAAAFGEAELDRYARHIVLREIGGGGQKKLKAAKVLVIGAGGLGSPVLLYLAAAGVGTIGVIDDDAVANSNLQRQIIHTDARIGMAKVASAEIAMKALNPFIEVRPERRRLTGEIAAGLFADYDLILDGSDNFDTRYLANRIAVALGKPLISAAITQWEGQIGLYHPGGGGACYECVFPERPAEGLAPTCAVAGVIAPLPGILGAMMALEAVKLLTGAGRTLRGELLIHDALWGETRKIRATPRADCPACGGRGAGI
jgi:molybdopterin/thiamine biosynthesis adenylyltransferase